MKRTEDTLTGYIGVIVLTIGIITVSAITNGWAISVLWGWFIVPVFNAPVLTIIQAIGVSLAINFIVNKQNDFDAKDYKFLEVVIQSIVREIFVPLLSVGIGYILTIFM